jgi:hypothetical protein
MNNIKRSLNIKIFSLALVALVFLAIALSFVSATSSITDMSLHYTLDDNLSTTNVIDSMGIANGTLLSSGNTNSIAQAGKINSALYFNGTTASINTTLVSNSIFNNSNGLSISMWVKADSTGGGANGMILDKSTDTNGQNGIHIRTRATNSFTATVATVGSTATAGSIIFGDGNWYNIVITINSSGTMKIWTNKINVGSNVQVNTSLINNTLPFTIGNRAGATDRGFNGTIDDIRIYPRDLTQAEINTLYDTSLYGGSCVIPHNMQLYIPVNLCNGSYNLNGSTTGAIRILDNGVTITGNNTIIYGNSSSGASSNGIYIGAFNNTIINSLSMYNYDSNVYADHSINVTLSNVNFTNSWWGLYTAFVDGINISNSNFNNIDSGAASLHGNNSNLYLFNNTILSSGYLGASSGYLFGFKILNNYVRNETHYYHFRLTNAYNGEFANNYLDIQDNGIMFTGRGENVTVHDNIINNSWAHHDSYDNAIILVSNDRSLGNSFSNYSIYNNQLIDFGCVGINIRDFKDNGKIFNNTFSQSYSNLLTKTFDCYDEPLSAININEKYKGWIPEGAQTATDNITIAGIHNSSNIQIYNNTFANINVLLKIEGGNNITNDFNNTWYRSFEVPNMTGKQEFYISNDFNNVSTIYPTGVLNSTLFYGMAGYPQYIYSLTKDYSYFKRINVSRTEADNIVFYSLNSAKITKNSAISKVHGSNQSFSTSTILNDEIYIYENQVAVTSLTTRMASFYLITLIGILALSVLVISAGFAISIYQHVLYDDPNYSVIAHVVYAGICIIIAIFLANILFEYISGFI